ncbi:response regulator [Leptolyngbya sp. FACHB-261]|uniref:response regulator n=1 Tax=Leptolyngbya sp. FACHB-261 TaxID=2692806 RepID=UPI001685788A|nr:response regulator [Leptolyngbya sp. FACHB-261]MBD2103135.1 response regulator [Leptolyngbya sp. FACHB-261]
MDFQSLVTIPKQTVSEQSLVLVVDDDEDNRLLSIHILELLGYICISADNGHTALELSQQHRPALILLDVAMPGMDGLAVVDRLKQNPQTATIPVIALTAMAMVGDRERILRAGFDDYLSKPYDLVELELTINRHLSSSPML